MASLVTGSSSDGFSHAERLEKEHLYALSAGTIEDLVARLQATMTTVDYSTSRRVRGCLYGALSSALEWTEGASNTYCNYEAPIV
jgi:hypothetical protein